MAKTEQVKVSSKGHEPVLVDYPFPESLEDPRWEEIVKNYPDDVNALAVGQFRVRLQAAGRQALEDGAEAVQEAMQEFVYGQRTSGGGGGRRKAKVSADVAKKAKFSKEQLEALKAAGIEVEEAA